jgi:plasmid stabilization system protein ParE
MASAVWTPLAEADIEEILFYIRVIDGRPETSRRIGEELRDCAKRQAGRSVPRQALPNSPDGWFYVKHKRWLIFYQPHPDGIEVMRVVDAARDLPSAFH